MFVKKVDYGRYPIQSPIPHVTLYLKHNRLDQKHCMCLSIYCNHFIIGKYLNKSKQIPIALPESLAEYLLLEAYYTK